jgi:hypothetical protein
MLDSAGGGFHYVLRELRDGLAPGAERTVYCLTPKVYLRDEADTIGFTARTIGEVGSVRDIQDDGMTLIYQEGTVAHIAELPPGYSPKASINPASPIGFVNIARAEDGSMQSIIGCLKPESRSFCAMPLPY